MVMNTTYENKAAVKNGVMRMVLVVAAMLIGILVLFGMLLFAGSKAFWIYILIHIIGLLLVLGITPAMKLPLFACPGCL